MAAGAASPQWLAPGILPAAPHPWKDKASGERHSETFLPFSCQGQVTVSLSPFRKHLCCSMAFVSGALGLLCIQKCLFFTLNIAVHQVGSPCPVKVGIIWQGSHPGASTASSTWDCCWNWEGSSVGQCWDTSSRFGVGSWAGLVALC